MNHALSSPSPSGKLPKSDRKSFFKFLAADIKGNRDAIRAEVAANPLTAQTRDSSWDARNLFDNDSTRFSPQCPTMRRHTVSLVDNEVLQSRTSVDNQDILMPNRYPVVQRPQGNFGASLVASSPSRFEEPSLGMPKKESSPCVVRSLGHSTDSSCDDLLTRAENWNVCFRASSDGDVPLCASLLDQQSNMSTAVNARVEWRNDTERHFVISTGTQELLAFPLSIMKIERIWGVNPFERIVTITIPHCDSGGFHAVSLKLDSCDCLERLSRMTGLDIVEE